MKRALLVPAVVLGWALMISPLEAYVLCAKKNPKTGALNEAAPIRARAVCKSNEITLAINQTPATMAFSPTGIWGEAQLSDVLINGGSITAPVEPGSTIDVSLSYFIEDTACPTCIDQIQVGFSHQGPMGCVFSGVPLPGGSSGSATFTITAPATPGTYFLGFDRSQDIVCPAGWWNGAPHDPARHFASITVE
jgi:hypothetical protein